MCMLSHWVWFVFFRSWQQNVRAQATVAHWSLTSVTCPTRRRSCPCFQQSRRCTRVWTYASTMLDWRTMSPCLAGRQRAGGTWWMCVDHTQTHKHTHLEIFRRKKVGEKCRMYWEYGSFELSPCVYVLLIFMVALFKQKSTLMSWTGCSVWVFVEFVMFRG